MTYFSVPAGVRVVHPQPSETPEERESVAFRVSRGLPCCDLAERRFCVCIASYTCPTHGTHCHGTHD